MACSLLSYAAFLIAFVSGMLFLIQERQVKRRTLGWLFHALPSLGILDRANFIALSAGFGLLSAGLISGLAGMHRFLGRWWTGDPKEYLAWALWLSYLLLWMVRVRATLRGHRVAWLSVFGFSLVLMTCLGAGWLLHSLHPYQSTYQKDLWRSGSRFEVQGSRHGRSLEPSTANRERTHFARCCKGGGWVNG